MIYYTRIILSFSLLMLLNVSPSLAVHTRNEEKQIVETTIKSMGQRKVHIKYSKLKGSKASKRSVWLPVLFIFLTLVGALTTIFLFFWLAYWIATNTENENYVTLFFIGSGITLLGSVWNIRKILRNR